MSQRQRRTRAKARRHGRRGAIAASAAIGLAATPTAAQAVDYDVSQVADINPAGASNPRPGADLNGTLLFAADDGTHGAELWKSDGTTGGTVLVKDLNSDPSGSYPYYFTTVGGSVFFIGNDGSNGKELWKTDGTTAGTQMVKDIRSGPNGSYPSYLTNVNGTLYFRANDGAVGYELWKSDGTQGGTTLVQDIRIGDSSYPGNLTNAAGTLFFAATDAGGRELWRLNGPTASRLDINPGPGDSGPQYMVAVGGTVFFRATDGPDGYELWKADNTGASMVKDIRTNPGVGSYPNNLANVGGTLFFRGNDATNGIELWKSDGTEAGTVNVKDINPGAANASFPEYLTNVGGTLFFKANDGTHGPELWKSDGTSDGTVQVKDIRPGPNPSLVRSLTNFNGVLFFAATDGVHGLEPWRSDGTAEGTDMVKDIQPGTLNESSIGTYPYFAQAGGLLFFVARGDAAFTDDELWRIASVRPLSVADATVNEAAGTVSVTVSAPAGSFPATFDYTTADATATAGADYTATSGSKSIPANATSTTIDVPITDDLADEPDETFTVTLSNPNSPNTIAKATATVTITDDDAAANPPPPPNPPSNAFTLPGSGKANLKKGTLTLDINLPGAGTLSANQQGTPAKRWFAKKKALIKPVTKQAVAGHNKLVLTPSKTGKRKLKKLAKGPKIGKLKVPTTITFTPTGGSANAENKTYKLKMK